MKQTTSSCIRSLLIAGAIFCAAGSLFAQEGWINAAYVKAGAVDTGNASARLAVRTGPGMNYSQVGALTSGTKVQALETRNGWMRIDWKSTPAVSAASAAPAAPVSGPEQWINAAYVKNGAVDTGNSSAKLAVRTGPGLNHSQTAALSSGQKISVLETRDGWIRIAPVSAAPAVRTVPAPVRTATPARPAPAPAPVRAATPSAPRPVPAPIRPPVDNLILNGDFSSVSLAVPTSAGDTTEELSGRWLRSETSPWELFPSGGNLGPYVRAAASREPSRLLYVVSDSGRSKGSYVLRFDYILTDPSDVLGVKVFVSNTDIRVGTDGGDFRMNSSHRPSDMVELPASKGWTTYYLPVELGSGYNCIYVLFSGSGTGNTGIDNISFSPRLR